MPLTFEETKSLIAALGLKIAENVLQKKEKAEQFKARHEKVATAGGAKPADWHLKKDFDGATKRASEAAAKQDFNAALKLLDEAEELLQKPDAPPAAAPEPAAAAVTGEP